MKSSQASISRNDSMRGYLGKRTNYELSTPNLLGIREEDPSSRTPFDLKKLLGDSEWSDEESEGNNHQEGKKGFNLLKFPSPSPSTLLLTRHAR